MEKPATSPKPYEHTQVAWAIVVALVLPILLVLALLGRERGTPPGVVAVLALAAVTVALFASLTVKVDAQAVSWRFGIGVIRRRIELGDVLAFRKVHNPWYWGWGIRWYPGGKLYNVSGFDAVELALRYRQRVRVGTDEADALCAAFEARLGPSLAFSELDAAPSPRRRKSAWASLLIGLTVVMGLCVLSYRFSQPPVVVVNPTGITVDTLLYGQTYASSDIRRIELVSQLPRIGVRTNGYAALGTLRGWFRVDELGSGKLFVELGHPPFIVVHLSNGFVGVNYGEPAKTQQLFTELRRQFPELVTPVP